MCGIFGIVSSKPLEPDLFVDLGKLSERRGRDSSGALYFQADSYSCCGR